MQFNAKRGTHDLILGELCLILLPRPEWRKERKGRMKKPIPIRITVRVHDHTRICQIKKSCPKEQDLVHLIRSSNLENKSLEKKMIMTLNHEWSDTPDDHYQNWWSIESAVGRSVRPDRRVGDHDPNASSFFPGVCVGWSRQKDSQVQVKEKITRILIHLHHDVSHVGIKSWRDAAAVWPKP